jgi:acyl carrier protein
MTPTELVVAKIWRKELSVTDIDVNGDFFALGGDSIQMLTMLFHVKQAFGVELSPGVIFENSSLQRFSLIVDLAINNESGNTSCPTQEDITGSL